MGVEIGGNDVRLRRDAIIEVVQWPLAADVMDI